MILSRLGPPNIGEATKPSKKHELLLTKLKRTKIVVRKVLDVDVEAQTKTVVHYDETTDQTHIQTIQNVEPYLKKNRRLQEHTEYKEAGKKQGFMHIATIPNNVIVQLKNEHGVDVWNKDDLPKLERLLNTREFAYLRVVDRI